MDAILQGLSGIFEVAVIAGLGFFLSRMGFFWGVRRERSDEVYDVSGAAASDDLLFILEFHA